MADRIISVCAVLGGLWLMGLNLYEFAHERGVKEGAASVKCTPKIHRMTYTAEEHRRAARAIERMEKVK